MDNDNLILTESVSPPALLEQLDTSRLKCIAQEQKRQVAKDFESVLLNKLLDIMNSTIGDWGFEKDSPSRQVQGIFSIYLARDIANNGGLGLWKDIYRFLSNADDTEGKSLDGQV